MSFSMKTYFAKVLYLSEKILVNSLARMPGFLKKPDFYLLVLVCIIKLIILLHVTSLPWPYRQMYSCIRQKGGRTSSKSPRRKGSEDP